ncbi:MAG: metallophosphoesterase [Candidatus Omnitrophica bacterium]|nr:metallophosphoesterase [Candidatus Omnitrophota bacterium]
MNRRTFFKLAFCGGVAALAGGYTLFIERNIVQVNRYKVPVAHLPPAFHGFTITHLTDLHLGLLVSAPFIEGVVARTNQIGADLIVCTGDYVHERNSVEEIDRVWPILSKLKARYGVYSILGNHDHWADTDRSLYWLERTGQNIRHKCQPVYKGNDRIILGGAGDYWEDELRIDAAFACSDKKDCRILLTHNPDSIDTAFQTPLSLILSGHTHGGQVIIPFLGAPVLPVKNKRYSSGLIATPRAPLFISRGIGWAILPVRLNCFPEIAVLELVHPRRSV